MKYAHGEGVVQDKLRDLRAASDAEQLAEGRLAIAKNRREEAEAAVMDAIGFEGDAAIRLLDSHHRRVLSRGDFRRAELVAWFGFRLVKDIRPECRVWHDRMQNAAVLARWKNPTEEMPT